MPRGACRLSIARWLYQERNAQQPLLLLLVYDRLRSSQVSFLLSIGTPGECTPTTALQLNTDTKDDYDIHIPLSAIPLGVNLGPSLEVLSFVKDAKTGELPWIARRGWLEVGDALVSIVSPDEEDVSEVSTLHRKLQRFVRHPP